MQLAQEKRPSSLFQFEAQQNDRPYRNLTSCHRDVFLLHWHTTVQGVRASWECIYVRALELAEQNNQKNYGDVITAQHVIHFADCANRGEVEAEFGRIGFVPRLEVDVDHGQFAFWKPDDAVYSTKSFPKKRSRNLP